MTISNPLIAFYIEGFFKEGVVNMRKIDVNSIKEAVKKMAIDSNYRLSSDVLEEMRRLEAVELSPLGKELLGDLVRNAEIAGEGVIPICQDTGMAIVYIELGQDVALEGGYIYDAVNAGVREGYAEGFLRKSVVSDPILRKNTGDNTPAVIHVDIVPGDRVKIMFSPKGFGSENMSRLKMLNPSDGEKGIMDFVLETVEIAGPNPCPPIVVGVGIGGSFEKAALLAKRALFRKVGSSNPLDHVADLEKRLLMGINALGIGPEGLGGSSTSLGVNVEVYPTHIAGLPVAVNISCHATRHVETII
jgi:fumarate hydratase subunit alpha